MSSIEDRVRKLEDAVFGKTDRKKDWRSTVGKFDGDPFMNEVIEGALESREAEWRKARENSEPESQ